MAGAEVFDSPEARRLLEAVCLIGSEDEAAAVLSDLCTPKEVADLAHRLEMARLLDAGEPYLSVCERTGGSSTTVSRVSKCLNGGAGGYRLLLGRMSGAGE